ncbi:MAG: hypothetical protein HY925_12880 [Elusimicrobia bacterium]|nr:hypothetical protein [Elusimicrobiota bacterium]
MADLIQLELGAADASFARIYPERRAETKGDVAAEEFAPAAQTRRPFAYRFAQTVREGRLAAAEPAPPAPPAGAPKSSSSKLKAAAAIAGAAALAAVLPQLTPYASVAAAAGSVVLTLIGVPQIVKNFRGGKESVKDLVIASPLIWFAAATLLSIASIGQGASFYWNAANVAGVVESGIVVGQIAALKRDKADLKATALTAIASAATVALVATQAFMPLKAWADLSFTAAMGLLWVLNWPQIRQNYKLFAAEGRAPKGIAPAYPASLIAGSLLHLFAAIVGGDMRWAMNAIIAIVTASAVLAQVYVPRAANAVIGPLSNLQDKVLGLFAPASPIERAFGKAELARFAGTDAEGQVERAVARAAALPGRSVIFLEAPTAAGKSTLVKGLEAKLGKRVRALEVDRYFKPGKEVPRDSQGLPDFDRPDAMYLDRVAADIRTLLAGGKIELPAHDMATSTTRFDSGEFMTLAEDEVLVIDSIFASHPLLRGAAEGRPSLNVYLDAPAVVRLARRLARDKVQRGKPVADNLKGWARILANEREHILPLKAQADLVLNLIEPSELAGLKDAYRKLLASENEETARLLEAMIRASLDADGVR